MKAIYQKNKLIFWFGGWFAFMLILMALGAPEETRLNKSGVSFRTTESEELYFKNMRSFFYHIEEDKQSGFTIYRIKSRNLDTAKASLTYALVNNWRQDETYILTEANPALNSLEDIHIEIGFENGSTYVDSFYLADSFRHYLIAEQVFEAVQEDSSTVHLTYNNRKVEIWKNKDERKSVRRTLKDYFKLTGRIY
jgi:hypothetical protein